MTTHQHVLREKIIPRRIRTHLFNAERFESTVWSNDDWNERYDRKNEQSQCQTWKDEKSDHRRISHACSHHDRIYHECFDIASIRFAYHDYLDLSYRICLDYSICLDRSIWFSLSNDYSNRVNRVCFRRLSICLYYDLSICSHHVCFHLSQIHQTRYDFTAKLIFKSLKSCYFDRLTDQNTTLLQDEWLFQAGYTRRKEEIYQALLSQQ